MAAFTEQKMRRAARLRSARQAAGLSQERAAALVGTSRRHWIRWENGESAPNPAYLDRIADALGDESLREDDEEDRVSAPPLTQEEFAMLGDLMARLGGTFASSTTRTGGSS